MMLYILAGFVLNAVAGAFVWAMLDDEQGSLLKWYKDADSLGFVAPFARVLVLTCWPVGAWMKWRFNRHPAD